MDMPNPFILPVVDFVGGTTTPLTFNTFVKGDDEPFDLSECTATFSLINYVNQTGDAILSKQMEITTGLADQYGDMYPSVAMVTLESADTAELHGKFIYQITFEDSEGKREIYQGVLFIYHNIDQGALL